MGNRKEKKPETNETIIAMAQSELVQKHGEASSQMIQAYKGVRYDSSAKDLNHQGRSLEGIAKSKLEENQSHRSLKQQAGFSAELIKEARDNKEAIKSGDPKRTRTTDGIGETNHQQHDHVIVDGNGNLIEGSGSQMKFLEIKKSGRATVVYEMVKDENWEKYDIIDLPEDHYQATIEYADKKADTLRIEAKKYRDRGDYEKAKEIESSAKRHEDLKKKLRKSNVKDKEALDARKDPKKFTRREVMGDSHKAGLEAAKGAAIIGGSIALGQNIYALISEEKSIDEAIGDLAVSTIKSGGVAYGIGAAGTSIKSVMHTSSNSIIRKMGTTNAPAMIATGFVQIGKSMNKYANGEIDEVELLEELGEKGTGMVAGGFGAAVGSSFGTVVLPGVGSLVGAFMGSMIAYSISSVFYNETLNILKSSKISEERRKIIEEMSEKSIAEMKEYQSRLIEAANIEIEKREESLEIEFNNIYRSIINNNMDDFFKSINEIGSEFDLDLEFEDFEDFDLAMRDDDFTFIL